MRLRSQQKKSSGGFTMVEVAIGGFIMALVAGASIGVLRSGRDAFSRGAVESATRARATATVDAIADRLADCGVSTASIGAKDLDGGPYLTVQRCLGAVGSVPQWGPPITIGLSKNPNVVYTGGTSGTNSGSSGTVNNQLAMWVGGQAELLGSGLSNDGFDVKLDGSVVTVTVTIERAVHGGDPIRVTVARKIHLTN